MASVKEAPTFQIYFKFILILAITKRLADFWHLGKAGWTVCTNLSNLTLASNTTFSQDAPLSQKKIPLL
jgi:hypothetical protein